MFLFVIGQEFLIPEKPLNIRLPFCTVCFCELVFSALMIIKSKCQSILEAVEDILNSIISNNQKRFNSSCKSEHVRSLIIMQACFRL